MRSGQGVTRNVYDCFACVCVMYVRRMMCVRHMIALISCEESQKRLVLLLCLQKSEARDRNLFFWRIIMMTTIVYVVSMFSVSNMQCVFTHLLLLEGYDEDDHSCCLCVFSVEHAKHLIAHSLLLEGHE